MNLIKRGSVWIEPTPRQCPKGHGLSPGKVSIGWDGSQRTYRCGTCDAAWGDSRPR